MATLSIVVPVYFNADTLEALKKRLDEATSKIQEQVNYIFVDDGSGDNSFQVLNALAAKDPKVQAVKLSRNFGSNVAIYAGLAHSQADACIVLSADLQDPPELIPELVDNWKKGVPIVLAARRKRDDSFLVRLFAGIFNRLFRKLVFKDFPPDGFDFMLIDKKVKDILVGLKEKNSYIFGQVMWVGFKRSVVHYDRAGREQGQSRWTLMKKIKYFIDAFTAFSYTPIRMMSFFGFIIAGAGILYAIAVVLLKIFSAVEIPMGWASVSVIVLTVCGTQLILMGVLGEYLWRALDESRHRPLYIVEKTINMEDLKSGK